MHNRPSRSVLACLLLAGFVLTACSGGTATSEVRGALTAIGSPIQSDPIGAWSNAWRKNNNATSLNYSPDGAVVGLDALSSGEAYFAALDAPLTPEQQARTTASCGPDGAFSVPVSITPIGVAFNMPSLRGLRLSRDVLAGIFSGEISRWDAEPIAVLNPDATLPDAEIIPVLPTEPSAQVKAATTYLSKSGAWSAGISNTWNKTDTSKSVKKNREIADEVDQTAGSIAFMDLGYIGSRFDTALLDFGSGFVRLSKDSVAAAVQEGETRVSETGVEYTLPVTSEHGYSLGVVSYQAYCSTYKNAQLASLVRSWGNFVVSPDGQVATTFFASVASPSETALKESRRRIETIKESK